MLKIIGGEFRSRRLASPIDDLTTRPYPHRVRESVVNLLREWFEGARVLDLFAGVGSMGLEAVSQGATHVLMVERDRTIFGLLKQNIDELDCGDRADAMMGDALGPTCLARAPRPVDIVFIDPPYLMMKQDASRQLVLGQMARCRTVMGDKGFVVLRSPIGPKEADLVVHGFDGPEAKRYGKDMWLLLYAPQFPHEPAPDPEDG